MNRRLMLLIFGFALAGWAGYRLAQTAASPRVQRRDPAPPNQTRVVEPSLTATETPLKFRRGKRLVSGPQDSVAVAAGAIAGQRIVVFSDQAALEDFLKRMPAGIKVLDRLDALHALRLSFSDGGDALASLLSDKEQTALIFPVDVPPNKDGSAQPGAVALGDGLLEWLGVSGENAAWGKGVTIAILDTGVMAHSAFQTRITRQDLLAGLSSAQQNGHGTAVASMIISNDPRAPGVAPAAAILSIRIADDQGRSDSFLLAKGIIAAVDGGAQIINISLGSVSDSPLVRNAVEYARLAGAVIVAAAGNQGENRISFPAANPSVIAVGGVDGAGDHLDFSNTGAQLSLSAAGFQINAAAAGNQFTQVSGTSFSSPIVAGAIAAVMSQSGKRLNPQQAFQQIMSYLNDSGAAGVDPIYGGGLPDLGRVLNGNRLGLYDAAIAGQRVTPATARAPFGEIEILVQNRGTMALTNLAVVTAGPAGIVRSNITSLPPNKVQTVRLPIPQQQSAGTVLRYDTRLEVTAGVIDAKPSNNRRVDQYVPASK